MENILLNSGEKMPILGLGTADPMYGVESPKWIKGRWIKALYHRTIYKILWIVRGFKMAFAIKFAIKAGYRMIDTSASYNNGFFIKLGIEWSKVKRKDIFIITRIGNVEQWNSSVKESVNKSLRSLDTDYIDLFMFHWPVPDQFINTWNEMEEAHKEGLVKSIGVANCHKSHLEKIAQMSSLTPAVNEIEIHPLMSQVELVEYCFSKNIFPMAYTPLGRMHEKIVNNDLLIKISQKYNKTFSQVILRWHIQRGIPAIPRSMNKENIEKNIDIFDFKLDHLEMGSIDSMNENLRLRYDSDNVDFTKC